MDDGPDMADARAGMRSCPQPARQGGRWLRAAVFALLSSALAVIGHHLASEDPVSWQRVAVGVLVVFTLAWPAARSSRPGPHVAVATGLAQLLLHQALSVPRAERNGHSETHGSALEIGQTAHHNAWAMTAAHCVAACAMALLMHRADQVLSRLPETVGRWAQGAVAAAVTALRDCGRPWVRPFLRTVPVAANGSAPRPLATALLCHAVVRRGPPADRAGDVPLIPSRVPRELLDHEPKPITHPSPDPQTGPHGCRRPGGAGHGCRAGRRAPGSPPPTRAPSQRTSRCPSRPRRSRTRRASRSCGSYSRRASLRTP